MHLNVLYRSNNKRGENIPYYRLNDSYRDADGKPCTFIILNIGFEPELSPDEMLRITRVLDSRFKARGVPSLFTDLPPLLSEKESNFAEKYWEAIVRDKAMERFISLRDNKNASPSKKKGKQ